VLVSIYRYNPETDDKPYTQSLEIKLPEGKDLMVLDVLALAKQEDPSVAYRRSCREGVCGSDGMNINGTNGLACITPVSNVVGPDNKLTLRPLPGLPVIRDLVVDLTTFYKQFEKVKPYLVNDQPAPDKERLQSPEERKKIRWII
jgi:succinate dehydrogenase / fumarate reductase iron-sulfur subunit